MLKQSQILRDIITLEIEIKARVNLMDMNKPMDRKWPEVVMKKERSNHGDMVEDMDLLPDHQDLDHMVHPLLHSTDQDQADSIDLLLLLTIVVIENEPLYKQL